MLETQILDTRTQASLLKLQLESGILCIPGGEPVMLGDMAARSMLDNVKQATGEC